LDTTQGRPASLKNLRRQGGNLEALPRAVGRRGFGCCASLECEAGSWLGSGADGLETVFRKPGVAVAVAVPSRIFVGITMFGLISALVVVPFTFLVVSCDPDSTSQLFGQFAGNDCTVFSTGQKIFLGLASLLTVSFTVLAWRALLAGARRDAIRRRKAASGQKAKPEEPQKDTR
jgi:hypothetical protein